MNLPRQLEQQAKQWAEHQGISLEAFVIWAVAEKVGALSYQLDDPQFSDIEARLGASGLVNPTIRGTGIRVQTIVVAAQRWLFSPQQIAQEYDLTITQVNHALAFYELHRLSIDGAIAAEQALESLNV